MGVPTYRRAFAFVKQKHRGQFRADHVPQWSHLAHVSKILSYALEKHREGNRKEREIISIAALGHDIFEDTETSKREVQKIFGERGLTLIDGMTNTWGDNHPKKYVAKMMKSEEAVRLIKLADLYDNTTSVAYHFNSLGPRWTTSYFIPIVFPMWQKIQRSKFGVYRHTAAELMLLVRSSMMLLEWEVESVGKMKKADR